MERSYHIIGKHTAPYGEVDWRSILL